MIPADQLPEWLLPAQVISPVYWTVERLPRLDAGRDAHRRAAERRRRARDRGRALRVRRLAAEVRMMRKILALAWLNAIQLLRNPAEMVGVLVLPLALTMLFGSAFSGGAGRPNRRAVRRRGRQPVLRAGRRADRRRGVVRDRAA